MGYGVSFWPGERVLMGPGPSNVSPRVLKALSMPILGHLDPEFLSLLDRLSDNLRKIFRTSNTLTLAISGTGSAGMEASFVNTIEPRDDILIGVNGVFGQRMVDVATRAGGNVHVVEAPMGEMIEPDKLIALHKKYPNAKVLAVVHAETSTGVRQPLEEIGIYLKDKKTLFIVDAVTSLGGIPVFVDDWGIDVCYSGTQKCLSVPPGLSPITFSHKAEDVIDKRKTKVKSWYLDLLLIRRYVGQERLYHHTAPVSMLYALLEGTQIILEEGLENRWQRHERLGKFLHDALIDLGFEMLVEKAYRLPELTTAILPQGVNAEYVRKKMLEDFSIEIGAGLGSLKGKVLRIGLMGETCKLMYLNYFLYALRSIVDGVLVRYSVGHA